MLACPRLPAHDDRRPVLRPGAHRAGLRRCAVDDADPRPGRRAPEHPRRPAAVAAGRRAVRGGHRAAGAAGAPGLVCDVAIGQSTLATQHVKANLFYRGLTFFRFPSIGDTLFTRTEVVGLKKNSAKPGRAPTGLMALRITTIDQADRLILDFYRCAMLPLSAGADPDGSDHADDLSTIGADLAAPPSAAADWNGDVFRERVPGPHFDAGLAGIGAAQ